MPPPRLEKHRTQRAPALSLGQPGSSASLQCPLLERAWVTLTKPAPSPEQANSLSQGIKHPNKILAGSREQLRQPYKRGAAETLVIKQKATSALCKKQLYLILSAFAHKVLGGLQRFAKHTRSAKAA